jgi:hypothetical protein
VSWCLRRAGHRQLWEPTLLRRHHASRFPYRSVAVHHQLVCL